MTLRVVLDVNVLLSGLMSPDSIPGKIVQTWRGHAFTLVVSEPLLDELARVLAYPKIRKRLGWDDARIMRYISLLRFETEIVSIAGIDARVPTDPDDDHVLATLLASRADVLISGDKDLLALAERYPILSPQEFVRRHL